MKRFLFLIPILFLFSSCWIDSTYDCTVKNTTAYDVQFYYSEYPATIYNLDAYTTVVVHRKTNGYMVGVNLPSNLHFLTKNYSNFELVEIVNTLYTYTVYNPFGTSIRFTYNGNDVVIAPGKSFTFQDYSASMSFVYIFDTKDVPGDINDLIIVKTE